jgi:hypothetical protein
VAAGLAKLSDAIVTNREQSAEWLRKHVSGHKPVRMQPVFSNVGEPETVPAFEEREPYAVVWGGQEKNEFYEKYHMKISQIISTKNLNRIVDIGVQPSTRTIKLFGNIQISHQGFLKSEDISKHLLSAKYGFLYRNPQALTKSGVMAAYFAHGLSTLAAYRDRTTSKISIQDGKHYLSLEKAINNLSTCNNISWKKIGGAGNTWYKNNAYSLLAAYTFIDLFKIINN